jgi:hypothetical protein
MRARARNSAGSTGHSITHMLPVTLRPPRRRNNVRHRGALEQDRGGDGEFAMARVDAVDGAESVQRTGIRGGITGRPSGFFMSEAILAVDLFPATPMEQGSPPLTS